VRLDASSGAMSLRALLFTTAAVASGCASVTHTTVSRGDLTVHSFTRDSTAAHLLVQGDAMVMVDSGYAKNAEALEGDLKAAGFDPAKLRAIVLTHAHGDHSGGSLHFQQAFHVPVIAGAGDAPMLKAGAMEPLCPTGALGSLRHGTDQAQTWAPTVADISLSEPLELKESTGVDAKVVLLPGHTRGSLVVVAGDMVFVGDLFRGSLVGSSATVHLYNCDVEGNKRDVAKLLNEIAPNAQLFFPGHFGPIERAGVADGFDVH
jgi:glyoxylase-like metal-dependent hydrolase (beta-lactamase superfamily II)